MTRLTPDDLIARAEISDMVQKYATGIDHRDWALLRSIFTDEFDLDLSSWNGVPAAPVEAAAWVEGVRGRLSGFDATQHISSNHVHVIDGDDATCTSYMVALHHLVETGERRMHAIGGYYTNRLRLGPDGWKIRACTLTVTWEMGDRGLFDTARARWLAAQAPGAD